MILLRRIGQNRPFVTLIVLCTLSALSLVTGVETTIIHKAINRVVAATAYPFLTGKNWVEESGSYLFGLLADFDAAQEQVAQLGHEQARLKQTQSRARELHNENTRLREMLRFTRQNPNLQLMPVNVIQTARGVLTIDRGALHGLQTSVGVIAPQGVVGIITEVSDFSASVATLHHADCKVGAMVLRNRLRAYDGIIHAGGSDLSRICTLQYIDMKDDVRVGDQIVTSAESLFPSGLPVGTVSRVQQAEGLLKTAEVIPAVDPYQLDEVFVIVTADEKIDDLRGPTAAETAIRNAAVRTEGGLALPDQKSMQERYAP